MDQESLDDAFKSLIAYVVMVAVEPPGTHMKFAFEELFSHRLNNSTPGHNDGEVCWTCSYRSAPCKAGRVS